MTMSPKRNTGPPQTKWHCVVQLISLLFVIASHSVSDYDMSNDLVILGDEEDERGAVTKIMTDGSAELQHYRKHKIIRINSLYLGLICD